jgi:conjugal transfer/type IV secretion protein DotA/TraY
MRVNDERAGARARKMGALLVALGLAGWGVPGLAQSLPAGTSIGGLMAAAGQSGDAASGFFKFLLGNFWDNPLSAVAGGQTGLFGALFAIYNAIIFVIGVMWASYGIGSAILETANTGEALGKKISTVWLPIRMVTGISGIVPVFGGFSLSQVVLVLMATLGIGAANLMTNAAIDATSGFNTVMSPAAAVGTSDKIDLKTTAATLFQSHVCMLAFQKLASDPNASAYSALADEHVQAFEKTDGPVQSTYFGSTNSPLLCGGYRITYVGPPNAVQSALGFHNPAVNYDAYTAQLKDAAQSSAQVALGQLDVSIAGIAQSWYSQRHDATNANAVPYPEAEIATAVAAAAGARAVTLDAAVKSVLDASNGKSGGLSAGVADSMKSQGFAGVGAWYSTFAEASAAFTNSLDSVKVNAIGPSYFIKHYPGVQEDLASIQKAITEDTASAQVHGDDSTLMNWVCEKLHVTSVRTATGDCSVGQGFVRLAIWGAADGSGGSNVVNPIIMFKNMGDGVLNVASALTMVEAAASVVGLDDPNSVASEAADIAEKVPGVGVAAKLAHLVGKIAWVLPYLVILGLLMSVYIPMIPFVTWMGGITQYVVIFCQGIVGMPIAAFAHLDSEGEGLGRRTEAGYMFILNVTFRPALMLFGFFMASGLMLVLGTFQANLFVTAMANAQGTSITGLYSVIGYLVLFAVMNVMLLQSLFNMIYLLPDQVLSLVGNHGHMADLGKEAEGKIHALFMSTGRSAQQAVHGLGKAMGGDGKGAGKGEGKGGAKPAAQSAT